MTSRNHNPSSTARFAHLEAQVGNVAIQLADFIKESKEHRDRVEVDQARIWSAIEKQGLALQSAVERLSSRGQISWGMIVSTGGLVLALIAAGGGVNNALMESRIHQLEIQDDAIREVREAQLETLRCTDEFILRELALRAE